MALIRPVYKMTKLHVIAIVILALLYTPPATTQSTHHNHTNTPTPYAPIVVHPTLTPTIIPYTPPPTVPTSSPPAPTPFPPSISTHTPTIPPSPSPATPPPASPAREFNPSASSTFSNHVFSQSQDFQNVYQDGSSISGYTCEDILQLGPASAKSIFGCADASKSVGRWDFDGIVGLGIGDSVISGSEPLFYSFCDSGSISQCIFSILLTDDGGEIQIGGYTADAVNSSTLVYTPVLSPCPSSSAANECKLSGVYTIQAQYFRVENTSRFFNLSSSDTARTTVLVDLQNLVTVVDSGVSCTLLPTEANTGNGNVVNMYEAVQQILDTNSTVFVRIGGQEFEIPMTGCFAPNPEPNVLTLGDTFFRGKVVVHDLTQRSQPRMGFAVQRTGYTPLSGGVVEGVEEVRKQVISSSQPVKSEDNISTFSLWKQTRNFSRKKRIDSVGVTTYDENIYFTTLSAGSPRQSPFIVQIDTGSSFTAIFATSKPSPPKWQVALLCIAIIVPVLLLIMGGFWYCGRKMRRMEEKKNMENNNVAIKLRSVV